MKLLIILLLWCILLVVCWPLALLLLVLVPVLYLLTIPIRLAVFAIEAILSLLRAILLLPSRLLSRT